MSSTNANPNAAPTAQIGHVHHHHEEVQAQAEARAQELAHHAHGQEHHHGEAHDQDGHHAHGHDHHEGRHDERREHHEGHRTHGRQQHGEHHTARHEHHEGHHPHGEHDDHHGQGGHHHQGHHHAQGGQHHTDEHHRAQDTSHGPAQHRHNHEHHHAQEATQGQAHQHGHHHHGQTDFADANRRHYDETAEDYDSRPRHIDRAIRVGKALREAVHLDQDTSSALEFASGTGLVARQLLPHVKEIVGIDISPGAVERCNKHFKDMGAGEGSYAVVANIMTDKNVLEGKKFDLVYCASAYHHFEHPEEITKALAGFLKPGGSLVIVDNIQKGGEVVDEKHKAYVTRYGFNEEDMKGFFGAAGLKFKSYSVIPPQPEDNDIFIATGVLEA